MTDSVDSYLSHAETKIPIDKTCGKTEKMDKMTNTPTPWGMWIRFTHISQINFQKIPIPHLRPAMKQKFLL